MGIGLEGADGLPIAIQQLVQHATLLVGSRRHLAYFPNHPAETLVLGDLGQTIAAIAQHLTDLDQSPNQSIVILTSGDPLFFGLGRLLLTELPPERLQFHPHVSSIQLAFSRIKLPWQEARIISAHGRSLDQLIPALQQGADTIALLTDADSTPGAISQLVVALGLPSLYRLWLCENLGGVDERVQDWLLASEADVQAIANLTPAALNVVVLQRLSPTADSLLLDLTRLPAIGIPDRLFLSFSDRPGLMTKREVRVLALAELAVQPGQVIWDIGAGTGSVAIELARLCPTAQIYAVEQSAAGISLIRQNCQRFQVSTVTPIHGKAPEALANLPRPDRVFIGGSGGQLATVLQDCDRALTADGLLVGSFTTLEHLHIALNWFQSQPTTWRYHLLQVQLARSVPIANLTRLAPLNPVTLVTGTRSA